MAVLFRSILTSIRISCAGVGRFFLQNRCPTTSRDLPCPTSSAIFFFCAPRHPVDLGPRSRWYRSREIFSDSTYDVIWASIRDCHRVRPNCGTRERSSIRDAACNGFGAFIGAVCATVFIRDYRKYLQSEFIRILFGAPSLLLLTYLICGILLDSYFPFEVTLDVSSVWHNLKNSQILPFRSTSETYWLNLSVDKGIPYGVIAYLFLINLRRSSRLLTAGLAWLLTIVIACAIELGKLFFTGRAFHSDNVVIASVGALLGVVLLPRFCALTSVKRHREVIWFMLVIGFLVYFELSPFDWIAPSELPGRFSAIEWLPFKSYYYGQPIAALFDLQKKMYSFIPLGFLRLGLSLPMLPGARS